MLNSNVNVKYVVPPALLRVMPFKFWTVALKVAAELELAQLEHLAIGWHHKVWHSWFHSDKSLLWITIPRCIMVNCWTLGWPNHCSSIGLKALFLLFGRWYICSIFSLVDWLSPPSNLWILASSGTGWEMSSSLSTSLPTVPLLCRHLVEMIWYASVLANSAICLDCNSNCY